MTVRIAYKTFLLSISLVIVSCINNGEKHLNISDSIIKMQSNWQFRYGKSPCDSNKNLTWLSNGLDSPGWTNIKSVNEIPRDKKNNTLWIRTVLPDKNLIDPSIYTGDIQQIFQVYLDNKLIYQFGNFDLSGKSIPFGHTVHLIPLPDNFQGKLLTFRIYSNTHSIGFYKPIILGEGKVIFKDLYFKNLDEMLFTVIYLSAGLILLFTHLFFKSSKLFLGLSIFLLPLGIWTGSNSPFLQLMLRYPYLFY
ncbi:MAG: hypothetical protein PVH88_02625 [Ignavibacteria bacterium]|jgi:hypothetical protein